ncbi:MAG: hypothetical protein NTW19_22375 [Planctomycetota bacterium]|nr:hypothetical protein [Planctomycetota bacterium]
MTSATTTAPLRQTIHLHNRSHRLFKAQGVTTGLPWPEGALRSVADLRVVDRAGESVAAAFTPLNTWPDGSLQWTLMDASLDLGPSADEHLTIEPASAAAKPARKLAHPVVAAVEIDKKADKKHGGQVGRIGNGLVELSVSSAPGEFLISWTVGGRPFILPGGLDLSFRDERGYLHAVSAGPRRTSVEHATPVRAVLRVDGKHGLIGASVGSTKSAADVDGYLDYYLRFEVRADRADVRVTYAFRNREAPTPGISVSDWHLEARTAVPAGAKRCFTANTRTRHYLTEPMRVDEDPDIVASDTGDLEHYETAHKDRANGDCFVRNPEVLHDPLEAKPWWLRDVKFRLQAGGSKCVWPYIGIVAPEGGAMVSLERMTSLHPKSLTVAGSTFRVGLWPAWAGKLEITQGAGRSHAVNFAPLAPDVADVDLQTQYLAWEFGGVHTHVPSTLPVAVSPDLDFVRRCKVFAIDKLPAYDPVGHYAFERKVLDSWIGVSYGQLGAVDQVNAWPAAGFWHFGDNGLGNNEEMHNLVYFQNYLRSGNAGCLDYALDGTRHMLEVDHCAHSIDAFQNGGQVAHTTNHNHGTAYPSHMWFTEYLFAYVLTGDREFLEGAKRACDNLLHWINDPDGFQIIAADQREAGQPLINLTWCHGFTRDERYLAGCWRIVRDYLMASVDRHGRMLDAKPFINPVKVCSYGDYAAWEGMYWLWEITRDEQLKAFMLGQLAWRVTPEQTGIHGFHRVTDFNPAAYGYYLTGDPQWIHRVGYPFWHAFRAARWPLGWIHAMYYAKLAFEHGIVTDRDVLVS